MSLPSVDVSIYLLDVSGTLDRVYACTGSNWITRAKHGRVVVDRGRSCRSSSKGQADPIDCELQGAWIEQSKTAPTALNPTKSPTSAV